MTIRVIAEDETHVEVELYIAQYGTTATCPVCNGSGARRVCDVQAYAYLDESMMLCNICGGSGKDKKRLPDKAVRCLLPKGSL